MSAISLQQIAGTARASYTASTPVRVRVLDAFLAYFLTAGLVLFAYCILAGTFPFNSFLAAFLGSVACFVLTASLRTQCDPATKHEFAGISEERAYADYVVCAVILFPVVWNFMG
eukprot:TRINITY_DN212_c0_g1_i1.p2 TRINITY_DN212_c0_g1~~TRINITY_DN212_c0_g1_i1.p2  ORF type:complete len:123 (-),score=50.51 TRINITY_DN212_c0_g1_i1:106-450(-)